MRQAYPLDVFFEGLSYWDEDLYEFGVSQYS